MKVDSKRGSYIMEAAIVLPIIIFVIITVVLIIMYFYSQMTERSSLHRALRVEAGSVTEKTVYKGEMYEAVGKDVEIHKDRQMVGGKVYGKKYLIMSQRGVLHKKGTFTVDGSCYAVDGADYVRYCNVVKGIADDGNEE